MIYVTKKACRLAQIVKTDKDEISLDELQAGVGGLIECLRLGDYIIYINDMGKLIEGMMPCFVAKYGATLDAQDIIMGDIVITKGDGAGGDMTMTDEEAQAMCERFNKPYDFSMVMDNMNHAYVLPVINMREA